MANPFLKQDVSFSFEEQRILKVIKKVSGSINIEELAKRVDRSVDITEMLVRNLSRKTRLPL